MMGGSRAAHPSMHHFPRLGCGANKQQGRETPRCVFAESLQNLISSLKDLRLQHRALPLQTGLQLLLYCGVEAP